MEESMASSMLDKEGGFCGCMALWLGSLLKLSSMRVSSRSWSSSVAAAAAAAAGLTA